MPQRDDGFEEDTLAHARRELKQSEKNLEETKAIVAQARHLATSISAERQTNHWADAVYQDWAGRIRPSA